jgi:type I site-specific restriction-modification system R (restriction) subunit
MNYGLTVGFGIITKLPNGKIKRVDLLIVVGMFLTGLVYELNTLFVSKQDFMA